MKLSEPDMAYCDQLNKTRIISIEKRSVRGDLIQVRYLKFKHEFKKWITIIIFEIPAPYSMACMGSLFHQI